MAIISKNQLQILGWNMQGDIGPFTCWRRPTRKTVWYLQAPPRVAPSPLQIQMRARWTQAAKIWQDLAPDVKEQWNIATVRGRLRMSGYALFVANWAHPQPTFLHTLERRTGTTLTPK